jgi:hypothetical protein
MKQMPDVLEHGWTRRSGPQITVANLTAAQAKEQVEYDKAVRGALKAMGIDLVIPGQALSKFI